jgi:hypothetical protein
MSSRAAEEYRIIPKDLVLTIEYQGKKKEEPDYVLFVHLI